jgi:spore coat polysaccharide biosynthesis predicted glycosyltransferase SpsG
MGLEYAVVDADTRKIASQVFDQTLARNRLSVAVSMGGVDAANKTLGVLETLRSSRSRLLLWVMLGEGYEHSYEDLVDCARGARHEIVLAKTNESMWHILGTCGLAILAGGTTTYQAAYAGLPSLNILESPERRFLLQELVDKGACLRAGDDLENSLARLNDLVEHFDAHRDELLQMHQNASLLIDGNGARRIAHEIAQMAGAGMASR